MSIAMRRRLSGLVLAGWLLVGAANLLGQDIKQTTTASRDLPTTIGSRLQLFVDEALIAGMRGVSLRLHRPSMAEVVLSFDRPWEGPGNHYVTVFKDGPLYRMYYRCVIGSNLSSDGTGWVMHTCYAESKDGIHWERPNLGLFEFEGNKQNNILSIPSSRAAQWNEESNLAVFRDENPNAPESERYKAVGGEGVPVDIGLCGFVSPDGIHWQKKTPQPIMTSTMTKYPMPNAFDAQNVVFWDTVQKQYVGYIRDMYPAPGTGEMTRGIRRTTSADFVHWSAPEWIDLGEGPPEQFYTNAVTPYFRAPDVYLGFPMRLMPHRYADFLPKVYDKVREQGVTDSVFMTSRDGENWRYYREAFIPPGINPLNWTDRSNCVAWGVVPTGKDEISMYVLEHYHLPDIHMRRAVLRTDGFVSASAPYSGGELVTRPIIFQGARMVINYSTSAAGGVRVEIQDIDGKPLPGFRLVDNRELFGDSVEQEVRWDGGPDVSAIQGRPVRLRFVMKEADLYSFRFQNKKSDKSPAP
jgi:hypothetical protein